MYATILLTTTLAAAGVLAHPSNSHTQVHSIFSREVDITPSCGTAVFAPSYNRTKALAGAPHLLSPVPKANVNALANIKIEPGCDLDEVQAELDALWENAAGSLEAAQAILDSLWEDAAASLEAAQSKIDSMWDQASEMTDDGHEAAEAPDAEDAIDAKDTADTVDIPDGADLSVEDVDTIDPADANSVV